MNLRGTNKQRFRARVENIKLPSVDGGTFYKGVLHVLELPSVEKCPFSHTWQCQVWSEAHFIRVLPHLAIWV